MYTGDMTGKKIEDSIQALSSFWRKNTSIQEALELACSSQTWPDGTVDLCGLPW